MVQYGYEGFGGGYKQLASRQIGEHSHLNHEKPDMNGEASSSNKNWHHKFSQPKTMISTSNVITSSAMKHVK